MRKINREPSEALDKKIVSFPSGQRHVRYLFACVDCGKPHWVSRTLWLIGQCKRCESCGHKFAGKNMFGKPKKTLQGKKCRLYRRGVSISNGYRVVSLPVDHPFRGMAGKYGRIAEHRLIMAKKLGRFLERWEIVHHKNRNKGDNRIGNLVLLSTSVHTVVTQMEREIDRLRKRIIELEALKS